MKATDGTGFWEDLHATVSEEFAEMSKWLLKTEAPRPFGSEKVSEEEQVATYALMRDDPEALSQFFTENNMKFETAVKWVQKMREKLG